MAHRYGCLQGHNWIYGDEEIARAGPAIFCPTCGLRLYSEDQVSAMPVPASSLMGRASEPAPLTPADLLRISRGSTDGFAAAPAIQPNDIEAIPGYELLGILGRGGMGIVFRARQLSLKRQVALKMILTGRHARPTERARFQREAEAVARLQHPSIVQIYEVGEQNGLPYCALEFVNAGSLAQFLGGNPQQPRNTAQFVHDLAHAMHYAHKRGIVHRDLKPANILLHLDEGRLLKDGQLADSEVLRNLLAYVPKITDFGLARHMGGEDGPFRQGGMLGTPSYMAPEQARGTPGEVGPAADVYALGAILYEMITGRPPFKATTVDETALQVLTQEPVPPTQLQPKIPKDLETICLVCLHKDPANRYASAEALAEDLRRFLAHEPILARRTLLPERVVKWAIRKPLLAAIGIGGLAVMSLLWYVWWNRAMTMQADRERMRQAWQSSEDQLQQAMRTIDQMAESGTHSESANVNSPALLLKARAFYENLLEQEGPPPRMALAHFKLGKIHERLGDLRAAEASYRSAIRRWEKLIQDGPVRAVYQEQLLEVNRRLSHLTAQSRASR